MFPGDILVGDKDGVVVIRRQDASEVADAAQNKKAGEDKRFKLLQNDFDAYTAKHLAITAKRFEDRSPEVVDAAYTETYRL